MKHLTAIALSFCGCLGAAQAQTLPVPGDFFLISRGSDGEFRGSHKIFHRQANGLRLVTYCTREYWVRPYTVAWTQLEVENERVVRVEFNRRKGWRPICENPEEQVTLKDLGIELDPNDLANDPDALENPVASRFSAIGEAFRRN
jgi:hypothetical protein